MSNFVCSDFDFHVPELINYICNAIYSADTRMFSFPNSVPILNEVRSIV